MLIMCLSHGHNLSTTIFRSQKMLQNSYTHSQFFVWPYLGNTSVVCHLKSITFMLFNVLCAKEILNNINSLCKVIYKNTFALLQKLWGPLGTVMKYKRNSI